MTSAQREIVQRVLDGQGYVILSFRDPMGIGVVIPYAVFNEGPDVIPGPMVIVGEASADEWLAQRRNYVPGLWQLKPIPVGYLENTYFYRVVAE